MSDFKPYIPTPGSIAWRLLQYFEKNPKVLTMTRHEIYNQLGIPRGGLDGSLEQAMAKQALTKNNPGSGEMLYMRGLNDKVHLRPLGELSHTNDDEELDETSLNDPFRLAAPLNVASLPILKSSSLDPKKRRELEFKDWLSRFEIGCISFFNRAHLETMKRDVQFYAKELEMKFRFAEADQGQAGMERVS